MPLSRTWYTRGNVPASDTSTAQLLAKSVLWAIKAALKNELSGGSVGPEGGPPAGSAWVCKGSSDSATAGMDDNDRWGATFDATKLVRNTAGNAHSWIVLKSPDALGPYYICLDWSSTSDTNLTITASKNVFTGGSTTARPTSTTEWLAMNNSTFNSGIAEATSVHHTRDADGNFFFHTSKNTSGIFNWFLVGCRLTEARAGDTHDFFIGQHWLTSGRGAPSGPSLGSTVTGRTYNNAANITGGGLNMVPPGLASFGGASFGANIVDSKYDALPYYVVATNVNLGGVRGRFPDMMMTTNPTVGASFPNTGDQEQAVVGDFLVPMRVVPVL